MTKIIFLYRNFRSGHIFQKVQGQKSKKFDQWVPWILSFRSKMTIFSQNIDKTISQFFSKILRVTLTMLSDCIMNLCTLNANIDQMPKFDSIRSDTKFSITFSVKINTSGLCKNHFRSDKESFAVKNRYQYCHVDLQLLKFEF